MRRLTIWTIACSCTILSFAVHAQDKLCLDNEIRQVKVTDLSFSTVRYVTAEDPTQTVEIPLNKVLILFNVQGSFLVPAQLDTTSPQASACLNRFFSIGSEERTTDELITKQYKILDVTISNEDDQTISWENNGKISKSDLAALINSNGTPEFFCSMEEAAKALGACRASALNLMNGPGSTIATTAPQAAKQRAVDPAATTTSTPVPSKPTPAPPKSTDSATIAATPSPVVPIVSDDSAAKRKIDSLLGGHHITRDEFGDKCKQKTVRFTDYMKILCDKSQRNDELNKATDACVGLFIDENAKVSVSSASSDRNDLKSYKIRAYLGRLKLLNYDRIEISWVKVQYIDDLKLDANGVLHGTVTFEQEFKGYKDNELVYSDVTTKSANVILETHNDASGGQTTRGWDVKLGDVGVTGTRTL